jgi:hypothetical protein
MNRFAILICLVGLVQGSEVVSAGSFPWARTRPKPVLLEEPQAQPQTESSAKPAAAPAPVVWHGTAVHPGSGRLYFPDASDRYSRSNQSRKPRVADTVARGWRANSDSGQAAPPKK